MVIIGGGGGGSILRTVYGTSKAVKHLLCSFHFHPSLLDSVTFSKFCSIKNFSFNVTQHAAPAATSPPEAIQFVDAQLPWPTDCIMVILNTKFWRRTKKKKRLYRLNTTSTRKKATDFCVNDFSLVPSTSFTSQIFFGSLAWVEKQTAKLQREAGKLSTGDCDKLFLVGKQLLGLFEAAFRVFSVVKKRSLQPSYWQETGWNQNF